MNALPVRLIATDLDGTLLRSDKTVSRANRCAMRGAADAGLFIVAATGRQRAYIPVDLVSCGYGHLVGANGAIGLDLLTDEVLFEDFIELEAMTALAAALAQTLPEARLGVSRDHGDRYLAEPGYAELVHPGEQIPDGFLQEGTRAELLSEPTIKINLRHPQLSPEELLAHVQQLHLDGLHATTSGAPFLELSAAGVNKASGLRRLCELLNVEAGAVLAFGDAGNDAEMVAWAGRGVAMGNATDALKAVADEVTVTNEADGVARVVEAVLADRRTDGRRR